MAEQANTIFIISEDSIFNTVLNKLIALHLNECQVEVFRSIAEIKSLSEKTDVSVILIDDIFSGSTGYEILLYLRDIKQIYCPVYYFCSCANSGSEERKVSEKGISYVINKPFSPNDLISKVKEHIAS